MFILIEVSIRIYNKKIVTSLIRNFVQTNELIKLLCPKIKQVKEIVLRCVYMFFFSELLTFISHTSSNSFQVIGSIK